MQSKWPGSTYRKALACSPALALFRLPPQLAEIGLRM